MSDLAEMLGIAGDTSAPSQSKDAVNLIQSFQKQKSLLGSKQKKVKSKVSREVLDLIGKDGNLNDANNYSAVNFNSSGPMGVGDGHKTVSEQPHFLFKKKRSAPSQNEIVKAGWVWTSIQKNSDASPSCFYHWIRNDATTVNPPSGNEFKDITSKMFEIIKTDTVIEEDWNLEDTNDLMKLCEQYELFWPVIIDRIKTLTSIPQQSGLRSKSVEELQSRYYFIKSKTGDSKSKYHGEDFVSKERNRRRHQDWLFRRTKEEELQETKLKDEIKLIESQLKKMKKQSKQTNAVTASQHAASSASAAATVATMELLPVSTSFWPPVKGRPSLQSARLNINEKAMGISKAAYTKLQGYLRSLPLPEKPIPTEEVCEMFDDVRSNAIELLYLQAETKKKG